MTAAEDHADEFPSLADGSRVPFRPSEVARLNEWNYNHFLGVDGTGGGGHHHSSTVPDASKFPIVIDSLHDLQEVQDQVLDRATVTYDEFNESYVFRSLVTVNDRQMIVDVVIDLVGVPVTVYPVNGNFVRRNDGRVETRILSHWIYLDCVQPMGRLET